MQCFAECMKSFIAMFSYSKFRTLLMYFFHRERAKNKPFLLSMNNVIMVIATNPPELSSKSLIRNYYATVA